jgi:hypothetical protein
MQSHTSSKNKPKSKAILAWSRYFHLDAKPQLDKRIEKNLAISPVLVSGKLG